MSVLPEGAGQAVAASMWPVVARDIGQNFGDIRDPYEKKRVLLE